MAGTDEDDDSPSPSPSLSPSGTAKLRSRRGTAWHANGIAQVSTFSFPTAAGRSKFQSSLLFWFDINPRDEDIRSKNTKNSFILLDPDDIDSESKSLLQQVLWLYMEELPKMNYATKTRNKSQFLEQCVSHGKYRTLMLMSHGEGHNDVIAAVSYQIVPNDTRYAEIPLFAVRSMYQRKGIGQILYKELRERLESVGITTIFCWAGEISEWFWLKQDFTTVGGVDIEGKVSKIPIRADIRRALSFPRGSILMVAYAKNTRSLTKSPPIRSLFHNIDPQLTTAGPSESAGILSSDTRLVDTRMIESGCEGQSVKRKILESSLSSFKSKRVKVNHGLPCDSYSIQSSGLRAIVPVLPDQCKGRSDLVSKQNLYRIMLMNIADVDKRTNLTKIVEELGGFVTCDGSFCTHVITGIARKTMNFSVALSSGAWIVSPDWLKKSFKEKKFVGMPYIIGTIIKLLVNLGAVDQGESEFILEDEEYLSYYKTPLRHTIALARANPRSLLRGYHLCLAKHIHPPAKILFTIIQSAGGNIICSLDSVKDPSKTIFLASEEDISEAFTAVKMGIMTFTSDWLMDCVMAQQLDWEAAQFVVSLS